MMKLPADLKYTKDHEWIRDNGDGTATIGITDFAQGELGDIVFVEINDIANALSQNDIFGTVEAVKTVSELYMPIDGKIIDINKALDANPELVNDDPYGEGWMIKIRFSDLSQVSLLLSANDYQQLIA